MKPVAIVGAAAVSPRGIGWRGLSDPGSSHASTLLAATHPGVRGFEVPPIRADADVPPKARRLMSRGAWLAAIAMRDALIDATWSDRADVGCWLGVGASGGPLVEMVAMLQIARDGDHVSMLRLGREGLLASNPLQSFQVLNNFTMCHGAILEGTSGPNGAFFSRGAGTAHALAEAVFAISDDDCRRALAGGSDTALHPVTWAELVRDGFAAGGLVPSEGAAVLALANLEDCCEPLAIVDHVGIGELSVPHAGIDVVVIAPWGAAARDVLSEHAKAIEVIDATAVLGEALAATPALAWTIALDRIASGRARGAAVLSLGPDGEPCTVLLRGHS